MAETTVLTVYPRDVIGKANRRLAKADRIAAVLYGMDRDAMPLSVGRHDFELLMAHHAAGSMLVEIQIEGEKKPINAMIREMQRGVIKGEIMHVDFLAVNMNETVHAVVALHLINDPAGVKAGGVLTIDKHDLNVEAKPGDLPDNISHDVSAMEVGDSLHVSDIVAPKGVKLIDDADALIASVTPPTVSVEPTDEAASEPELVGKATEE